MRKFMPAALLAALLPAPARAYYTPHNPHFSHSSGANPTTPASTQEANAMNVHDALGPGAWNPSVRQAVDELIAQKGLSSKGYDAQKPPVAILSWEGVFFIHDAAEAVFDQMVESARFKADDAFWAAVPAGYGRQKIRAAYEQFSVLPQAVWQDEPTYLQFRKYFVESYRDQCAKESWSACRAFLTQLFCGFSPDEAERYAATVINAEEQRPLGQTVFFSGLNDAQPEKIAQGLRQVPEIKGLVAALLSAGFDVWVIDEDPQPVLEAEAAPAGVPASRVIGIRTRLVKDVLTGEIQGDVPARGAKTAAAVAALGRVPDLVVGASSDDAALLDYGQGVRVLVDHGDKKLDALARKKGWLVQPAFGP